MAANAASLTSEESARKSLIESWCYDVTLIDDSDTQANFDTAAATNVVAYISEEVDSGQLFEKLKNVPIGVVNEDRMQYARPGFSNAVGSSLQRRFALHEAEAGGVDAVTMHVQADASSRIQHYSDKNGRVGFILLGYWTGVTYVERFDAFKAGANASWLGHDLGVYGVAPNPIHRFSGAPNTVPRRAIFTRSAGGY